MHNTLQRFMPNKNTHNNPNMYHCLLWSTRLQTRFVSIRGDV